MRKSILMILIGLFLLISIAPLIIIGDAGICLSCLIGMFLFFTGLILLINGIITLARNVKKDDTGVDVDNDKFGVSSLIEPLFWVKDSTMRILRNRRRSSAMLSGIILSSLVIGSVFIFTEAMQEDFYNDFVKEIPFEASFSLREEGTEKDLWNLADEIEDDRRVESSTVIGGLHVSDDEWNDNYDKYSKTEFNMGVTFPINENSTKEEMSRSDFFVEPIFIRSSFSRTTIHDKIFRDGIEGSFDLDPETNKTVIPRTSANRMFLEVGDTIEELDITLYTYSWSDDPANPVQQERTYTLKLRNVTISGIYSDESEGSYESGTFFFNTELLERYNPEMKEKMEEIHLFVLAVKIDASEFSTSNMEKLSREVDGFVRDVQRESDVEVRGQNNIGGVVFMLNIIRYVLIVIDFILILPVVILSIYFLIFGLDLSLEERKREVAILKVQGADTRQIYRNISMESFMLFVIGLTIGYFLSIVTGWIIMSSIGFMTFDFSIPYLKEFFGYHQDALIASSLIVGLIVLISVFIKARRFIKQEVSEGVQRTSKTKKNFIVTYLIALPLLAFGTISALKEIMDVVFDIDSIGAFKLSFGEGWDVFIFIFLGTISLWIGGALSGPIIAQTIALKTEKLFLKLFFLKDVALIIKSGLRRRGDTGKLVLIIVLTLSVATLASVQGMTDQMNSERNLEYEIGADYQVILSDQSDNTTLFENVEGVKEAMAVPSDVVIIDNREIRTYGIDADRASFLAWHPDSFRGMSADEAMDKLDERKDENGVFFGKDLSREMGISKGDTFTMVVPRSNPIPGETEGTVLSAVLLGTYDHFPSALGRSSMICDHSTMLRIRSLKNDHDLNLQRTVPVIDAETDRPFTDDSPEYGFMGEAFIFNISVSQTIEVEEVRVNWSHDDLGEIISLYPINGNYFGWIQLNFSLNFMDYTVHVEDSNGNINSSSRTFVRVVNIYYPNRLYDLSRDVGIRSGSYEFRISLGENIEIESIYINWMHGNRDGRLTLDLIDGFYTGSIQLDDTAPNLVYNIGINVPQADLNATLYLLDRENDVDTSVVRKGLDRIEYITFYRDLSREKDDIVDQINFGIPGLLTMMFVASIIAVFTSAFAFSSIIIKRRMREFAVLQTVGATRGQVYKIAIGENALVMLISVVMGLLVGIGLSYLMNPFFEGLGTILDIGSKSLTRLVFFPWPVILSISGAIFIGMLLAVAISAVSAARQDLAVSTRVV